MFKPYVFDHKMIGWALQRDDVFAFFGNRNFTKEKFSLAFPKYEFRLLKQVHGDAVVESSTDLAVADAHYTVEKNCALVIQTADCQPILFASKEKIAACHAGWRGVAQQIPLKTAEVVNNSFWISIGPHIQFQNFEVEKAVAQKILASLPNNSNLTLATKEHPDSTKVFLNLAEISLCQIKSVIQNPQFIDLMPLDTITEPSLFSFRRQGSQAERQYSFIVRL